MEKSVFKFSGEGAVNYDKYLGTLLFEPYAIEIASRIETKNIDSVLELASGTGRLTLHLRKRLPADVKLVATDLSNDMLEIAKERINDPSIIYQVADMQQLPFDSNTFDFVVCQFGLMFLDDKQAGVNEAHRVLKKGGKFIFSTWDDTKNIPLLKLLYNDMLLPFFNEADPSRFITPYLLHDTEILDGFMNKAGFSFYTTENVHLKGRVNSARQVIDRLLLKHSIGKEVSERNPDALEPMALELEKRIIDQYGPSSFEYELSAFVCEGEK